MSSEKFESVLQRVPRCAWLAMAAGFLVALVSLTRNLFVVVYLGILLIGIRVVPRPRAGSMPAIALVITLALMLGWRLLS